MLLGKTSSIYLIYILSVWLKFSCLAKRKVAVKLNDCSPCILKRGLELFTGHCGNLLLGQTSLTVQGF